ncbi:MAG TPA: hypothetical protein VHO25_19395 [Polyangiaceae bacterium]|nr:hypothetical protein [Polyangiaceae bacterium]
MHALKVRVEKGRYIIDEPASLPDGTELYVVPSNDADGLDGEERAALNAALEEAAQDIDAGRVVAEAEVWARLRAIT